MVPDLSLINPVHWIIVYQFPKAGNSLCSTPTSNINQYLLKTSRGYFWPCSLLPTTSWHKIAGTKPWLQGKNMTDLKWFVSDCHFSFHWHSECCQNIKKVKKLKESIFYKNIYIPTSWTKEHNLEILFLLKTDIW